MRALHSSFSESLLDERECFRGGATCDVVRLRVRENQVPVAAAGAVAGAVSAVATANRSSHDVTVVSFAAFEGRHFEARLAPDKFPCFLSGPLVTSTSGRRVGEAVFYTCGRRLVSRVKSFFLYNLPMLALIARV